MSNESPPITSGSPASRGTTDKEKKSSQDEKTTGKPLTNQDSNMSHNEGGHHEKTSDGKIGSQSSEQEKQKNSPGIWCDTTDSPIKENPKSVGVTQTSDCTQTSAYHTPDPRTGYLQVYIPSNYPMPASSNFFPPGMNFPPQTVFQQSNRNNERIFPEDQHGMNMMPQNACKQGWRDEFLPQQANYPNAPQRFQTLPRSGNARSKNDCNNKLQGNYVQPRMVYSDTVDKPSQNYQPHIPTLSQQPGVYSHNYFQDPRYNVRSPRKGDRPAMHNYGNKEIDKQRGLRNPANYYADPREVANCKRPLPTSDEYRYNYQDSRDPRFAGTRQFTAGSPKNPVDMRFSDNARRDIMRYQSPPERGIDREIRYPPMPYVTVEQNPIGSIRYPNQPGFPPPVEYKPWKTQNEPRYTNQDRRDQRQVAGLGGGPVPQHLNMVRPLLDFQRSGPCEYMEEARNRHEQPYYDPSYEQFDPATSSGQRRPMPQYNRPPMMSPMMPQMMSPVMAPMFMNPPPPFQGMPPQQMHQQNGQDCYGVVLEEIDVTQPTTHLRRCIDFPEMIQKAIPENCDKQNSQN